MLSLEIGKGEKKCKWPTILLLEITTVNVLACRLFDFNMFLETDGKTCEKNYPELLREFLFLAISICTGFRVLGLQVDI